MPVIWLWTTWARSTGRCVGRGRRATPCSRCASAIWLTQIDKVYYAAAIEDCLLTGSDFAPLRHDVGKPINERSTPCEHLLAKEGRDLIAEWAGILENDPAMRKLLGPAAGK